MHAVNSDWTAEKKNENVHLIRVEESIASGGEFTVLLQSDEHWDNPKCDRRMLKRHHEKAKEINAPIIKIGDIFCAMQGKYDRRSNKTSLRPEHQTDEYLDSLVDTAAEWYRPYSAQIVTLGYGNHETSIKNHHETDLLERLARRLRDEFGGVTTTGGYSGWVKIMFNIGTTRRNYKIWYHHGHGGGGPVTKGAIDFNRYAEWTGNSDCVAAGHVHYKNLECMMRQHLNDMHNVDLRPVHYVRCGTYKEEFEKGAYGFHVEKGRGPRPLGGWWLKFIGGGDNYQVKFIEAN